MENWKINKIFYYEVNGVKYELVLLFLFKNKILI